MATNLSIDPELIERVLEVSGEHTKEAAVTKALQEFIARRRQRRLLELMGALEWDRSYDYKSGRSREPRSEGAKNRDRLSSGCRCSRFDAACPSVYTP